MMSEMLLTKSGLIHGSNQASLYKYYSVDRFFPCSFLWVLLLYLFEYLYKFSAMVAE